VVPVRIGITPAVLVSRSLAGSGGAPPANRCVEWGYVAHTEERRNKKGERTNKKEQTRKKKTHTHTHTVEFQL
jgi:hypothetical protein